MGTIEDRRTGKQDTYVPATVAGALWQVGLRVVREEMAMGVARLGAAK